MRIISGALRGKRFYPPGNLPYRPTTDFAKSGIFNIISNHFNYESIKVLDLFAGTGNISFEFASRGCKDICTVDINRGCVDFIKTTSRHLSIEKHIKVYKMNVLTLINQSENSYDIIFAGPPYALDKIELLPDKIIKAKMIKKGGWFILEHNTKVSFQDHPNLRHQRSYGSTVFSIFF